MSSKSLLILLVLLAACEFIVRGPVRFLRAKDFNDFIPPYTQSKALLKGMDPYSPEVLVRLWPDDTHPPSFLARDLAEGSLITKRGIPTAYPLTCLFLIASLAVLPWPVAYYAWLVISVCLTFGLIWSLLLRAGFGREDWRSYAFVAFSLALAPLHTGLAAGSIVIVAVALCGIAVSADQPRNEIISGVFLGLSICLKPQIGLPFLAYYLLRRRWRLSGVAASVVLTTAIFAMTRLAISGTPWIQNYRMDNKVLLSTGILSDFTERNPIRFSLINLQVLLYAIRHQPGLANAFALGLSALLSGIWVFLVLHNRALDALLPVSAIAVLSLFPVYHRMYDAFLLIFPLCWAFRELSSAKKQPALGALLLILPFLVPGGSALEQLQASGRIPGTISHSWYWVCIVMPHQIWFLLLLSVLLLAGMAAGPQTELIRRHGRYGSEDVRDESTKANSGVFDPISD
jgi:hypothetical protein